MARQILVASASKHGSTQDIADAVAGVLARRGFSVVDKSIDEAGDVRSFDAAVIGSGVYVGRWMPEAISFVNDHAADLATRPVWLFSSGPLGDPLVPQGDPTSIADLDAKISPRGHRVFAGRLEAGQLGLGERMIVAMVRAPSGDFRDFAAVEAWANEIADSLDAEARSVADEEVDRTREALLTAAMR